ncbi:hypothetical protein HYH03_001173 [Edaphochlamys debaryana]|uniref:Uncharacterized protein n=1 Tax=Edaphochlamys debaryana TaxID=47281 RepID=A0A836C603_9CHLO|nr:hypothetical protein HYH03_001173 [Edaphochlamys debaryana]|eukprot:KAG2501385.1 hypothetical protein HYH03_001173 [Edaphochlamys debaryana]
MAFSPVPRANSWEDEAFHLDPRPGGIGPDSPIFPAPPAGQTYVGYYGHHRGPKSAKAPKDPAKFAIPCPWVAACGPNCGAGPRCVVARTAHGQSNGRTVSVMDMGVVMPRRVPKFLSTLPPAEAGSARARLFKGGGSVDVKAVEDISDADLRRIMPLLSPRSLKELGLKADAGPRAAYHAHLLRFHFGNLPPQLVQVSPIANNRNANPWQPDTARDADVQAASAAGLDLSAYAYKLPPEVDEDAAAEDGGHAEEEGEADEQAEEEAGANDAAAPLPKRPRGDRGARGAGRAGGSGDGERMSPGAAGSRRPPLTPRPVAQPGPGQAPAAMASPPTPATRDPAAAAATPLPQLPYAQLASGAEAHAQLMAATMQAAAQAAARGFCEAEAADQRRQKEAALRRAEEAVAEAARLKRRAEEAEEEAVRRKRQAEAGDAEAARLARRVEEAQGEAAKQQRRAEEAEAQAAGLKRRAERAEAEVAEQLRRAEGAEAEAARQRGRAEAAEAEAERQEQRAEAAEGARVALQAALDAERQQKEAALARAEEMSNRRGLLSRLFSTEW